MKLFMKAFILATVCYAGQIQAVILQQGQFVYKNAGEWERIIGLSKSGFILKTDAKVMTFESWTMRDLLSEHEGYIKSLKQDKTLYSVENLISCSLNNQCKDDSLKSHVSLYAGDKNKAGNLIDVCLLTSINCVIFNTDIDGYTFEAYVYTNSNNNYFMRVLTNINVKSELLEHLNSIELNSK